MASSTQPARSPGGIESPNPGAAPGGGVLLSAADVGRVVDRMAHQLIERAATTDPGSPDGGLPDLVLVGIPTRGAPLARRLAARIEAFSGTRVDVGTVDITLYRDDCGFARPALAPTVLRTGDRRRPVVLATTSFSGRLRAAARRAARPWPAAGRAARRPGGPGHRELPIRAAYVGRTCPRPAPSSGSPWRDRRRRRGM